MAPMTRTTTSAILSCPFTLHPNALRKLGVVVPEAEPALEPVRPPVVITWGPYTSEDLDDDYSPTSPRRAD